MEIYYIGKTALARFLEKTRNVFAPLSHSHSKADITDFPVADSSLSTSSTNFVQNKVVTEALNEKVPMTRTINGKSLAENVSLTASDVGADASGAAADALSDANAYTDGKISSLINSAPTTLDTLGEIATAMEENEDVVAALESAIGTKANGSDLTTHTGNTTLHITATERTNWNNAANEIANAVTVPASTTSDNGKFLRVVSGVATWTTVDAAEGVTF